MVPLHARESSKSDFDAERFVSIFTLLAYIPNALKEYLVTFRVHKRPRHPEHFAGVGVGYLMRSLRPCYCIEAVGQDISALLSCVWLNIYVFGFVTLVIEPAELSFTLKPIIHFAVPCGSAGSFTC